MAKNPILDELHSIREQLLDAAGGTLDALVDRLQAEEQLSDRPRYKTRPSSESTPAVTTDISAVEVPALPPADRSH